MSPVIAVDHVQLAMPAGGEDAARAFYAGVLGLTEQTKPPLLAARGGCWFEDGPVKLHLGVEDDVRWSDEIPGTVRCHVDDPFGNRLELIDAAHARTDTAGLREAGPP